MDLQAVLTEHVANSLILPPDVILSGPRGDSVGGQVLVTIELLKHYDAQCNADAPPIAKNKDDNLEEITGNHGVGLNDDQEGTLR